MTDLGDGIVEIAREMYKESDATKGKVVSTLVYGVCWDETVRFIKKNYPEIEKNSNEYGNYSSGDTILTGSEIKYSLNNIYDMAGNVWEWTMESNSNTSRCGRGGGYDNNYISSISDRGPSLPNATPANLGGRVQIYIK